MLLQLWNCVPENHLQNSIDYNLESLCEIPWINIKNCQRWRYKDCASLLRHHFIPQKIVWQRLTVKTRNMWNVSFLYKKQDGIIQLKEIIILIYFLFKSENKSYKCEFTARLEHSSKLDVNLEQNIYRRTLQVSFA